MSMGLSSSKLSKGAAKTVTRRYPTQVPLTTNATNISSSPEPATAGRAETGPTVHPETQASEEYDHTISSDASDPHFAASLRSLGPVQPNSTLSNTSTFRNTPSQSSAHSSIKRQSNDPSPPEGQSIFPNPANNPALIVLQARDRLAAEAEQDFTKARTGGQNRKFLDVGMIRQIISLRDEKHMQSKDIEKSMGLAEGVVSALAAVGEAKVGKKDKDDSGLYG